MFTVKYHHVSRTLRMLNEYQACVQLLLNASGAGLKCEYVKQQKANELIIMGKRNLALPCCLYGSRKETGTVHFVGNQQSWLTYRR